MTTRIKSDEFGKAPPDDGGAAGPRNEAERRLYDLIQAGLQSGAPRVVAVADLTAELRARAVAARAKNAG